MLKLVLLMSKKMFPAAFTLILAVVVSPAGMNNPCEPSFGVPASKRVG